MNEPKLPCWLKCPECGHQEWCSEEDPDAGQSGMRNHLYWDHALKPARSTDDARRIAGDLLAKVVVIPGA